jgi:hypothetical protein
VVRDRGDALQRVAEGVEVDTTGMRAIVAESADHLVWAEVPDVVPDHGEVLIKVSARVGDRPRRHAPQGRSRHYPPAVPTICPR